jgi:transcriptional regulator with XRE-family HTH domain/Zn-dependent peptidase ImmA (M78 family)
MKLDQAVGQRISKAREFLGLTQAVVAQRMGLARTTQVAIEQGHRAVSVAELQLYCDILGRPLSYFFGEGMWGEDGDFRAVFRQIAERLDAVRAGPPRRPGRPRGSVEAPPERRVLAIFEALCRQQLDLLRLNRLSPPWFPNLPQPVQHSGHEAELWAATVRAHLDVGGEAPLVDLRLVLEHVFGVSAFVMPGTGRLTTAAFHHPHAGVCVLLGQASDVSLRFELARALGALLLAREQALVRVAGVARRGAASGFVAAFAGALLVPARGLRERYAATAPERGQDDTLALAHVARLFGVSSAVLRSRLHSLRLLPGAPARDTVDLSLDGEVSETAAAETGDERRWAALPDRYVFMALRAHHKGLIDTARLGECLMVDEAEARVRLETYTRDA